MAPKMVHVCHGSKVLGDPYDLCFDLMTFVFLLVRCRDSSLGVVN